MAKGQSMKKYARCDIVVFPTLEAKPIRRRTAEVRMDISAGLQAGPSAKPIKLIIKGENLEKVLKLVTLYKKTDEELAKAVHDTELAGEVEGKTVEETAAWVRNNVLTELTEMAKDA